MHMQIAGGFKLTYCLNNQLYLARTGSTKRRREQTAREYAGRNLHSRQDKYWRKFLHGSSCTILTSLANRTCIATAQAREVDVERTVTSSCDRRLKIVFSQMCAWVGSSKSKFAQRSASHSESTCSVDSETTIKLQHVTCCHTICCLRHELSAGLCSAYDVVMWVWAELCASMSQTLHELLLNTDSQLYAVSLLDHGFLLHPHCCCPSWGIAWAAWPDTHLFLANLPPIYTILWLWQADVT